YAMTVCAQPSQRATCPPSATVRQRSIALMTQALPRRRALALRAMPVAAAVVRDDRVRAALAARDMPAERDCAAALDRTHDPGTPSPPRPGTSGNAGCGSCCTR